MKWARASGVLALLGATVGSALDGIHTWSDTTAYAHPVFLRATLWTPPLFAGAALIGLGRPWVARRLGMGNALASPRAVLGAFALLVGAYFASALLPASNFAKAAALGALFVVSWGLFDRTRLGIGLAIGAAVGGSLTEVGLIAAGAFSYRVPDVAGIPAWLPCLYATASVALGLFAQRLAFAPAPSASGHGTA